MRVCNDDHDVWWSSSNPGGNLFWEKKEQSVLSFVASRLLLDSSFNQHQSMKQKRWDFFPSRRKKGSFIHSCLKKMLQSTPTYLAHTHCRTYLIQPKKGQSHHRHFQWISFLSFLQFGAKLGLGKPRQARLHWLAAIWLDLEKVVLDQFRRVSGKKGNFLFFSSTQQTDTCKTD